MSKADAHVLVPGCGDSKLGHHMRIDGYGKVLNIDFEEDVVDRMKIEVGVEGIEDYQKMDILDMDGVADHSQDITIDKGTIDALYSGKDEKKDEGKVDKYFNELLRVTKPNTGQIVIISLLQSHILKKIINFFLKNDNGSNSSHDKSITEVKVNEIYTKSRTNKAEAQFIGHRVPFLITIRRRDFDSSKDQMKKFKDTFEKMITINGNLMTHDDAKQEILITQMLNLQYGNIKELVEGRIIEINMESTSSSDPGQLSRFKLVLVDSLIPETFEKNTCAILIVPQGKETYPVYSTESGYRRLSESVGHSRLIVVHLKSGNLFESFDSVKKELESTIVRFTQKGYTNEIPYVSEGKDIGLRTMIGRKYRVITEEDKYDEDAIDEFEHTDHYIVEDLRAEDGEDDHILRAIKFKTRLGEVQSDIKIRKKKMKGKKDFSKYIKVRSPIWKTKEDEFLYIDHNFMNSEYLTAMIAGLCSYYNSFEDSNNKEKKSNFLVLGTGAGILPMFLYKTMSPILSRLNTVDLDEEIVTIGKDYFGFNPGMSKNFRSEIADAKEYLEKEALPGKTHALFIDIASSDADESYIPPKFCLTDAFFKSVHRILSKEHHVVLFNTCCYSEVERHSIHKTMNSQFTYVSYINCGESSNRVYILSNSHAPNLAKTPENTVKYFVKTFCDGANADGHDWATKMRMAELLKEMKYAEGNKAEVKIEQIEATGAKKKKKAKK